MRLLAGAGAVGLLAIAIAAFLALRGYGPSAFPTASYEGRAAAEQAGAFAAGAGGWLPAQIPPGATALRESHNPSTHQAWGAFRLPAGAAAGFVPARASRTPPGELMLLGAPANVDWWPAFLRGRIGSAELVQQGFRIFVVEQGEESPLVFAVRGSEAFFWRLARQ